MGAIFAGYLGRDMMIGCGATCGETQSLHSIRLKRQVHT